MMCDEIRTLLATRRHLSYAQEQAVQAHLAGCARCATAWQREEGIMQQFRALPVPSGELSDCTKAAIRSTLTVQRAPRRKSLRGVMFAGVAIVLILVASLLQPRIWHYVAQTSGAGSQAASSPAGLLPTPTTSPSGTLYIASDVTDANAQAIVGARVTAIDLGARQERYRVAGGDEATLSPDGTHLYVAGMISGTIDTDTLRAIDARTGEELWRVAVKYRSGYPGQSNLVVSPDGHWLYLRSYDQTRGSGDAGTVPFWLQIIDTTTGSMLPGTIALPNIYECGAPTLASPPVGNAVYISCYNDRILAINTQTQQIEPLLPADVHGAILARNQREMYVVNATLDVFQLDSAQRTLLRKVTMHPQPPFSSSHGLVALSGDGTWLVAGQTIQGRPGTDTACEIRVLDTHSGQELGRFRYEQPLYAFAVNATATTLYAVIGGWKTRLSLHSRFQAERCVSSVSDQRRRSRSCSLGRKRSQQRLLWFLSRREH